MVVRLCESLRCPGRAGLWLGVGGPPTHRPGEWCRGEEATGHQTAPARCPVPSLREARCPAKFGTLKAPARCRVPAYTGQSAQASKTRQGAQPARSKVPGQVTPDGTRFLKEPSQMPSAQSRVQGAQCSEKGAWPCKTKGHPQGARPNSQCPDPMLREGFKVQHSPVYMQPT